MTTSMRKLRPCFAVLLFACIATSASAFDAPAVTGGEREHSALQVIVDGGRIPGLSMHDVDDRQGERGRIGRALDRLRRVPLRPVRIGDTPRKPDDPEPGAGVVFKIRF